MLIFKWQINLNFFHTMTKPAQKSRTQFNKLQKKLRHSVGDAIMIST
jgi:hypothetical protein